jgi:beta-galactosidase
VQCVRFRFRATSFIQGPQMSSFSKDSEPTSNAGGVARRDLLKGLAVLAMTPIVSQAVAEAQDARPPQGSSPLAVAAGKRDQSFDEGWRFLRGDAPGAEAPGFNHSSWRVLDLPHDWSVEDLPSLGYAENGAGTLWGLAVAATRTGPFDTELSQGGRDTGWFVGGTGWYRRSFSASAVPVDGQVEITFDGVYSNSDVWLNGELLGTHPYGYTTFSYDLTPHLRRTGENVLAVRVRNEGKNSRWYSGSGIYRHVWLDTTGKIRIPKWGVSVTTPDVSKASATVKVAVKVENRTGSAQDVTVRLHLFDGNNASAGTQELKQSIPATGFTEVEQSITLPNPKLWGTATPQMYRLETELIAGATAVDRMSTPFGIRKVEIDAQNGLRINGEVTKLRGGCMHHDNGILGACAYDRSEERRIELMKAHGFNAIRTSHDPPSPMFLASCDRLGMLVVDEAFDQWEVQKNPEDYHLVFAEWWQRDLASMILRDRNHPSVILWSIGNEIPERAQPRGVEIAKNLQEYAHKLDPTRLVTAAINSARGGGEQLDPAFLHLDVGGYNYMIANYETDHVRHPDRIILGTESFPRQAYATWEPVERLPYVIGDFTWTAMDYLGESSLGNAQLGTAARRGGGAGGAGGPGAPGAPAAPGGGFGYGNIYLSFPWFNSYCGDIDLIGETKPQGYYRRVVWGTSKLEMLVQRPLPVGRIEVISGWGWSDELRSWTWPGYEGRTVAVRVASTGDQVRLLLNGKEVGTKPVSRATEYKAEFRVPYAAGELKAIAMQGGQPIAEQSLTTAGKPTKIRLVADRSSVRRDRNDVSYVKAEIVDDKGNLVPDAVAPVSFMVSGAGDLAAAGSANPKDVASFRSKSPNTYHGRCLAIVQPRGKAGKVTVRAQAPGLESGVIQLDVT